MRKIVVYIIPIIFALLIQSCEKGNKPSSPPPIPRLYNQIVKLSSAEYLDYVVAEQDYNGDSEHLCKIRGYGGTCQELYLGSSPYIPLSNGYYAIDWKWGDFVYEPTNFLIKVKWTNVKDRQQKWAFPSLVYSTIFLKEWRSVSYQDIDIFLGITSTNTDDYLRPNWVYEYNSLVDVPEDNVDSYKKNVWYIDSLQDVYLKRLAKIIEKNGLDDVCGYIFKY